MLSVERVPLDSLTADPSNVRRHSGRNVDAIKASLVRFGQQKPIVVGPRDVVVAGNGTLAAAQELGWADIAIVRTDLAGSEATAFAIADNRTAELAEWSTEDLACQLSALQLEDPDLAAAAGFDEGEIEALIDQATGLDAIEEDEPPEPPMEPVTKPGDIWTLGRHRLVCGDCTDESSYRQLGAQFDAAVTDPPYGIDLAYDEYNDSEAALKALVKGFFPLLRECCETIAITCGVAKEWYYPEADWVLCWYYAAGPKLSSWGFQCWQPILVYGRDPFHATGRGSRADAVDMNVYSGLADKLGHPCPKTPKFWAWLVERTTKPGATIVDPFMGSGTGIVVAEQLGRTCMGIEISPTYCDIIVERWQNLTGGKATRTRAAA